MEDRKKDARPLVGMLIQADPVAMAELANLLHGAVEGKVLTFGSTASALNHIQNVSVPDVIVTDLHMPDIDGWRLCRLLRSPEFPATNATPILVTSPIYSGADVRELSNDLGANDFLSIPCDPVFFRSALRNLVEGRACELSHRALVVDDDPVSARVLARGLKSRGFTAESANDAATARHLFASFSPDVVFIDHHLPEVTGFEILREFKRPGTHLVAIVVTGDLSPHLAVEYTLQGADAFVHKPFDVEHLIGLVAQTQRQRALLRVEELLAERTRALRESDSRVLQAAKLASVGELAAGLAHEINNPMFGIMNCAEILAGQFAAGTKHREFAELIRSEGQRVSVIVRRLLNFARQTQDAPELLNISEIVCNCITLLDARIRKGGIVAAISVGDRIPPVIARRVEVQQVVLNLLLNACDALNERYSGHHPDKRLDVAIATEGADDTAVICIRVEDHGCGIPPENLEKLFTPFFTTKKDGTGLGLSICRKIASEHHGSLSVDSAPGRGTTFTLRLPIPRQEQEARIRHEYSG
jgi:signal transduction histidine kinase